MPGMFDAPFDNVEEFLQGASHNPPSSQNWQNEFDDFQATFQPSNNVTALGSQLHVSYLNPKFAPVHPEYNQGTNAQLIWGFVHGFFNNWFKPLR